MLRYGNSIRLDDVELGWLRILTQQPIERVQRLRTVDDLNRFLDEFEDLFREDWYEGGHEKAAKYFRKELDKFRNIPDVA